ncbi:hypothetical protein [Sporichthya sp.]|nr:hypothetical protein [Sporichthya sp.]MBA3743538.1 hypothetical protein [Sporichthya sp.]
MARDSSGRAAEPTPWSRKSRKEQFTAVVVWGVVAVLFLSIAATLLLG